MKLSRALWGCRVLLQAGALDSLVRPARERPDSAWDAQSSVPDRGKAARFPHALESPGVIAARGGAALPGFRRSKGVRRNSRRGPRRYQQPTATVSNCIVPAKRHGRSRRRRSFLEETKRRYRIITARRLDKNARSRQRRRFACRHRSTKSGRRCRRNPA